MRQLDLAGRLDEIGLPHDGFSISFDDDMFRIDLAGLTGGKRVTVYGQQEVMKDLYDAAEARGLSIVFDAESVAIHDIERPNPFLTWTSRDGAQRLDCDFIAGCDGSHGVSRADIPSDVIREYEKVYPIGWLGILAGVTAG